MSAYHLRDIQRKCMSPYCDKIATKALYNFRNALMGEYCTRHANQELKARFKEHEAAT